MYEIVFYNKAKKQLSKLPLSIQERIMSSLNRIKFRPFHFIKRKQETPYFILRVGKHRVILEIQQNKLIIFVIELGPRGKIYNK